MNVLKDYRTKFKYSQREIASIMGMSQANYQRLECGKSLLNAKQILFLCELYKCTPNDLLGFRGVHTVVMGKIDGEV